MGSLSDLTVWGFNVCFNKAECAVRFDSNSVSVGVPR